MTNEKRLIDADALKQSCNQLCDRLGCENMHISSIETEIDCAPTVDAVEVVRCKDCMYYHKTIGICFGKCSKTRLFPYDDDFCSYGERKDNGC